MLPTSSKGHELIEIHESKIVPNKLKFVFKRDDSVTQLENRDMVNSPMCYSERPYTPQGYK